MDFLNPNQLDDTVADSAQFDMAEKARMEGEISEWRKRLSCEQDPIEQAKIKLDIGRHLAALNQGEEAWELCRHAFDAFLENEDW